MRYTNKEDKFLRNNYLTIPAKRMSAMFGRSECSARQRLALLGITVPKELAGKFKAGNQFKPGHASHNKGKKMTEFLSGKAIRKIKETQFKKGHLPHNTKERDGVITVRVDHKNRNGKAYKNIRISLGKWVQYHRYVWEKKYGKIKKGLVLIFRDGNTMNCSLRNLKLITRKENMARNTIQRYPKEVITSIRSLNKLKRKINEKQAVRP